MHKQNPEILLTRNKITEFFEENLVQRNHNKAKAAEYACHVVGSI